MVSKKGTRKLESRNIFIGLYEEMPKGIKDTYFI